MPNKYLDENGVAQIVEWAKGTFTKNSTISAEYDSSRQYELNDLCFYEHVLYRCVKATTGAFDAQCWVAFTIGESISKSYGFSIYKPGNINAVMSFAAVHDVVDGEHKRGMQKLRKLVGVDVVKNQLIAIGKLPDTQTIGGVTLTNNGDGTITLNGTATEDITFLGSSYFTAQSTSHLYFATYGNAALSLSTIYLAIDNFNDALTNQFIGVVYGTGLFIRVKVKSGTVLSNVTLEPKIIDLTKRYGSNDVVNAIIGSNSANYVSNLLKFDPQILADLSYDEGSFASNKAKYLKTMDYNQWDEEWEVGSIDSSGANASSSTTIRSKNYMRVKPNDPYFIFVRSNNSEEYVYVFFYDADKNFIKSQTRYTSSANNYADAIFTPPSNCLYVRFYVGPAYGATYNHDICIFLYWDGSRIGYEPYEEHIIELPNQELHGILKVDGNGKVYADGDVYPNDGKGKTRYIIINLGDVNWYRTEKSGETSYYKFVSSESYSDLGFAQDTEYLICTKYPQGDANNSALDKVIMVGSYINVADDSYTDATTFKAAMDGVYLVIKKSTPTDLTDQPSFPENFYGDDFGNMSFLDAEGEVIEGLLGIVSEGITERDIVNNVPDVENDVAKLQTKLNTLKGESLRILNPGEQYDADSFDSSTLQEFYEGDYNALDTTEGIMLLSLKTETRMEFAINSGDVIGHVYYDYESDEWVFNKFDYYRLEDYEAIIYHLDATIVDGLQLSASQYTKIIEAKIVIDSDGFIFYHLGLNNETDYLFSVYNDLAIYIYQVSPNAIHQINLYDLFAVNDIAKDSDITKLYQHIIELNTGDFLRVTSMRSTTYTLKAIYNDFTAGKLLCASYWSESEDEYGTVVGILYSAGGSSIAYYSFANAEILASTVSSIVGDTVTPL